MKDLDLVKKKHSKYCAVLQKCTASHIATKKLRFNLWFKANRVVGCVMCPQVAFTHSNFFFWLFFSIFSIVIDDIMVC